MEPASLSLSILQIFVTCVTSYQFLSTAKNLEADQKTLQLKLQIEETRLNQWGLYWGFTQDGETTKFEANIAGCGRGVATTIKATLSRISEILASIEGTPQNRSQVPPSQRIIRSNTTVYHRAMWAFRDKAKLDSLLADLKHFNDSLHAMLPRRDEASLTHATACAVTLNSGAGGDLDDLIGALVAAHYTDAAKLARFKRAFLAAESKVDVYTPAPLLLNPASLRFSTKQATRDLVLASINGIDPVLVEWKAYAPQTSSGTAHLLVSARVSHLAELLSSRTPKPDGFSVPVCIGYLDDAVSQRYGIAYSFPPTVIAAIPPTLHELLQSDSMPPLGDRFKLALSLARSLNLLHGCGWVHKSFRSSNILFFQDRATKRPMYQCPYVVGFGYSRPDRPDEETLLELSTKNLQENQLYRHPEVQGGTPRRYRASDDVFSLGLVLLEVALWKRLTTIGGEGADAKRFLAKAKDEVRKRLPKTVGVIYQEAVQRCLEERSSDQQLATSGAYAGWEARRLREQNSFYWDVVKRLEECNA